MTDMIDFGSRENLLGTPDFVTQALCDALKGGLPGAGTGDLEPLCRAIAMRHGASQEQIALSASPEELLNLLVFTASNVKRALILSPCSPFYEQTLKDCRIETVRLQLHSRHSYRVAPGALKRALQDCQMLILGNPASPTGALLPPRDLLPELDQWLIGGGWLILDERHIDFTYGSIANSLWSALRQEPRAALIRSFTDLLSLSLCPLNYAVGGKNWLSAARRLQNPPAAAPLLTALVPCLGRLTQFRGQTVEAVSESMSRFIARLRRISGLKVFPGDTNWVFCRLDRQDITLEALTFQLRARGILITPLPMKEGSFFTLALRPQAERNRLIKALRDILMPKAPPAEGQLDPR